MFHPISLFIADHILGKLSLIVFRPKFYQEYGLWHAFSVSRSWLTWKSSLELNPLIQNSSLYVPGCIPPVTKRLHNLVVLINRSWNSPLLISGSGQRFYFSKNRGVNISPKKGEVIMKRVIYDCCLALCLEIHEALQSIINLWEWVLII